jgi:hypothetical protein
MASSKQLKEIERLFSIGLKYCNVCDTTKNINDFHKCKSNKYGLNYACKDCINKINTKWRRKNKDSNRNYQKRNREQIKERKKIYRKKNRKKLGEQFRIWKSKNIEKVRKYDNEYRKNRRKNDIHFRILTNFRSRIRIALICKDKCYKTMELIGLSLDKFKKYIESKFKNDMEWNNYGSNGWHIDHILPCELFDIRDERQQRICFNYKNLQPIWKEENHKKNDKLPDGRKASFLSAKEKLDYLRELGYDL